MGRRNASAEGGPPGPEGDPGTPGLVGPAGQASTAAVATIGITPAANAADMTWPGGTEAIDPTTLTIIVVSTVCRKNSTNATRSQQHRIHFRRSALGSEVGAPESSNPVTIAGSSPWAGTTAFAFSAYFETGRTVLRIVATGPNPAKEACTWDIKCAYSAELDRALV